jgi:hypothetical protein
MELVTGTWGFSNTRPSQVQKRLEQEDHNSRQQATVGSEGHTVPWQGYTRKGRGSAIRSSLTKGHI